jgi:signal transduction histidine kinase
MGVALVGLLVWRAYPTPHQGIVIFDDALRFALALLSGLACHWRAPRSHPAYAQAWRHLAAAGYWLAGAVAFLVLAVDLFRIPAPWSLLRHLGYLMNLVLIARATLAWPTAPGLPTQRLQALLDGLMISAALFFIAWGGFLRDLIAQTKATGTAYAFTLVYPIAAIALAALWLFQEARLPVSRVPVARALFRLALFFLVAFYVLYAPLSIHGEMRTFGFAESVDQLHATSLALFGLAALWPRTEALAPVPAGRPREARIIPFLPSLVAMLFGAWLLLAGRPMDPVMVAAGTLLGLVLFFREYLALRDLDQLSSDLERRVEERTEELRRKQDELLKAQRAQVVASLAAGLAHDFKNLLNVVLSWARILKESDAEEDRREGLDAIDTCAVKGAELIQQVLAAGHQQEVHPVTFDLAAFVAEQAPALRGALGDRARLAVDIVEDLWVHMDPEQLHRSLLNLAGNAADAMTRPGTFSLLGRRDPLEAVAVLRVMDDGSGIPPEALEHLFEPFFTTKGAGKGTGLGLASVQGALWQNGGSIEVESQPGRGTTFVLRLPLAGKD